MGRPSGTHDPRTFRHLAKLAKDGSVVAIVEVADGSPDPIDGEQSRYVEVTDLYPYDLRGAKVDFSSEPRPPVFTATPPKPLPPAPSAADVLVDKTVEVIYQDAVKQYVLDVADYDAARLAFETVQRTYPLQKAQFTERLRAQLRVANAVMRG